MAELLGLSSRHPVTLEMSFRSLIRRAESVCADGWGAVFYEQNDAYIFREPRPVDESRLAHLLGDCGIPSQLIISHIRDATIGPVELRNTHPFTREIHGRLHSFAFNGDLTNVSELELAMDRFCPIGETDGEFIFCWIMEQLYNHRVDNGAWRNKAAILKSLGEQLADLGSVSFLYSDSRWLYAFASPRSQADDLHSRGLYFTTQLFDKAQNLTPCDGLMIRSSSNTPQALGLIASMPLSSEEWIPLEKNQLLVFEKGELTNFGI
jgi:predicted glutamine amidotransferase